ncbi:hypothetical protein QE152_g38672 [Popillia japonica]|uniref:Uncharacterized protein n=1 Tax=Popillia japonica TaxID=7064 RepID=A0AAW1HW64_POPJA
MESSLFFSSRTPSTTVRFTSRSPSPTTETSTPTNTNETSTPSSSMPSTSRDDRLRHSPRTERAAANELESPPSIEFAISLKQLRELLQDSSRATLRELGPLPSASHALNDLSRQKEFIPAMERYMQSSSAYLNRVRTKYKDLWVKERVSKMKVARQDVFMKRLKDTYEEKLREVRVSVREVG